MEKYVKELSVVTMDLTKACGRMFEQEHLRFISMFSATRSSGGGGGGFHKGVMEHKVITNLRAVNGDKSFSDIGTKITPQPLDKLEVHMRR